MITVLNLDIAAFLQTYWQKKPCVIRNALPDFTDFIDEHELAGLAMEPVEHLEVDFGLLVT